MKKRNSEGRSQLTTYPLTEIHTLKLSNVSNDITKPMGFVIFITQPIIACANLYDQLIDCFCC